MVNIGCIVWFIASLVFGMQFPSENTSQVQKFFIPDAFLVAMNMLMTFWLYKDQAKINGFL
jgi:hypothetical protein